MQAEWEQLKSKGDQLKLKEIREFVKKHNLKAKTHVGGKDKRTKDDVLHDIDKAVEQGEFKVKDNGGSASAAAAAKPGSSSKGKERVEVAEVANSQKSWAEEDETTAPAAEGDLDCTKAQVEQVRQLAIEGEGERVISFVNTFNLSKALSKETLSAIADDLMAHVKKDV